MSGVENSIWSNIEANDESFSSTDQFDVSGDNSVDTTGFEDDDASLQQQVNNRRQRQDPNEGQDDNLTDPLARKPAKSPAEREQRQTGDKKKGETGPRTNDRGDLVDEQGNVIASRGKERRIEFQNQRLKDTVENLTQRNETLARQIGDQNFLNGLPKQFGLDNDTVAESLQIAALFVKDPAQAVRTLAQKAIAQGLELRDIFDDETLPTLGVKATKELLDQRLKPFEEEQKNAESVARLQSEGKEAANNFLNDYPDAEVHQSDIANLMGEVIKDYQDRGRKIDPYFAAEKAWEMLQAFGQENGLDITQPFKPQVEAIARQRANNPNARPVNGQRNATPRNIQPGVQRRKPMPNGQGSSTNNQTVQRRSQLASPEDDIGSIVRSAMIESGYNFNE